MNDIDNIMKKLDWNASEKDKKTGIELAKQVKNIEYFIQPCDTKYNKNVWDCCAIILHNRTDEELEPYIDKLLQWLQDANWPGFNTIFDRISNMDTKILVNRYVYCVEKALKEGDYVWLNYLSGLIKNKELYNLLPNEQKKLLKKHYKNYGKYITNYI